MRVPLGVFVVSILLAGARPALAQTVPSADAGADFAVECVGATGTQVQLDGTASSDADGQALSFTWISPSFPAGTTLSGATAAVVLPLGTHVITLEVADGVDGSDTDEIVVTVQDTTPPVLAIGGTPLSLWPPNHTYRRIDISRFVVSVTDACQESLEVGDARFGEVTSDEPENGTGDGDTPADILIKDECSELKVRSERSGNGDGRVYQAEILVEDASGNVHSARVDVARVFKAPPKPAVDSGDEYAVTSTCEPEGPGLCPLLPAPSCDGTLPSGRSIVRLYEHPRSDNADNLLFLMSRVDTRAVDFGDPTSGTEYQLCVYGREAANAEPFGLIVNPRASAGAAWRAFRGGFIYRARRDDDDGLTTILLRAIDGGRGTVLVWGFGDDLDMADLPLDVSAGVEVQLHNSLGQCWGASFPDALRNTPALFQAIGH